MSGSHAGYRRVLASDALPPPQPVRFTGGQHGEVTHHPTIRQVDVGGQQVLVTRLTSGDVVAFTRFCPHMGTPLDRASLAGDAVRCPGHAFVYDTRTGANVHPTDHASEAWLSVLQPGTLQTYPVAEQNGWIWVADEPGASPLD
jgi:nitrite reductase/ring-hydroxylating ferredoxin subunit